MEAASAGEIQDATIRWFEFLRILDGIAARLEQQSTDSSEEGGIIESDNLINSHMKSYRNYPLDDRVAEMTR
jgi:hypothetical protein